MLPPPLRFFTQACRKDTRKLNERKEEFYHLLTDAVVTCVKKLCIDLPAWADEFLLPKEQTLIEEQGQLSGRLEEIEKEHSTLTRFKRVLVGNDDGLVDDVVYLLTKGLGYRVNSDDNYREDIQILDEKGVPLARVSYLESTTMHNHL